MANSTGYMLGKMGQERGDFTETSSDSKENSIPQLQNNRQDNHELQELLQHCLGPQKSYKNDLPK